MKKVAIVQARMTSTRLPGKILMDVGGKPMLAQQLKRLKRCSELDEIVVASTNNLDDAPICELASSEKVFCFRGDEEDVLGRYVGAARKSDADVIVRITADCPLIDPEVADLVIRELLANKGRCDYVSNTENRSYPRGLDVEAFFADTLYRMDRLGKSGSSREHVTSYLRAERSDLFLVRQVVDSEDNSDLRLTVDYPEDLTLVRKLFDVLNLGVKTLSYREIVAFLRNNTNLVELNKCLETWNPTKPEH